MKLYSEVKQIDSGVKKIDYLPTLRKEMNVTGAWFVDESWVWAEKGVRTKFALSIRTMLRLTLWLRLR